MESVTLEDALRQYISSSINQTYTAIPGFLIKDPTDEQIENQCADVQVYIQKVNPDDSSRSMPAILNVPIIFPGSKRTQFSFPMSKGDWVMCIFSQRSLDVFKQESTKDEASPKRPSDLRKYALSDAVAIPGISPFPQSLLKSGGRQLTHDNKDTVIAYNIGTAQESEFRMKPNGDILINSPEKITVNCKSAEVNAQLSVDVNCQTANVDADNSVSVYAGSTVNVTSPTTNIEGDLNVNGVIAFTGSSFTHNGTNVGSTHVHGGVESGNSDTEPPK